jgi:glycerophosphoryl diester phosphodiesterase
MMPLFIPDATGHTIASPVPMPKLDGSHEIIAHRGFSARAPENTLAALEAAVRAGADAVEWDVQIASCGTPVLFHDSHLGRTSNGVGPVRRRTLGQLRELDAGSWFSAAFAGERIPSLEQALELVRGRVSRAYCEVKAYRELEDIDRIVAITRRARMLDATVFISLDWRTIDRIAHQDATARIGYIVDQAEQFGPALGKAIERPGTILDLDHRLVLEDPLLPARARARGVDVAAWTVNEVGEAAELVEAGVTRLTTNQVEALVAWRASLRASLVSPKNEATPPPLEQRP